MPEKYGKGFMFSVWEPTAMDGHYSYSLVSDSMSISPAVQGHDLVLDTGHSISQSSKNLHHRLARTSDRAFVVCLRAPCTQH